MVPPKVLVRHEVLSNLLQLGRVLNGEWWRWYSYFVCSCWGQTSDQFLHGLRYFCQGLYHPSPPISQSLCKHAMCSGDASTAESVTCWSSCLAKQAFRETFHCNSWRDLLLFCPLVNHQMKTQHLCLLVSGIESNNQSFQFWKSEIKINIAWNTQNYRIYAELIFWFNDLLPVLMFLALTCSTFPVFFVFYFRFPESETLAIWF